MEQVFHEGTLPKRQSTHRPPLLDNMPFDYWKIYISTFIHSQDYCMWYMLTY